VNASWLLAALVAVFFGHRFTPFPWASYVSGLGFLLALLLWHVRGPLFQPLWWICLWGAMESLGAGVCQGLLNWIPQKDSPAACDALANFPLTAFSILAVALITRLLTKQDVRSDG